MFAPLIVLFYPFILTVFPQRVDSQLHLVPCTYAGFSLGRLYLLRFPKRQAISYVAIFSPYILSNQPPHQQQFRIISMYSFLFRSLPEDNLFSYPCMISLGLTFRNSYLQSSTRLRHTSKQISRAFDSGLWSFHTHLERRLTFQACLIIYDLVKVSLSHLFQPMQALLQPSKTWMIAAA